MSSVRRCVLLLLTFRFVSDLNVPKWHRIGDGISFYCIPAARFTIVNSSVWNRSNPCAVRLRTHIWIYRRFVRLSVRQCVANQMLDASLIFYSSHLFLLLLLFTVYLWFCVAVTQNNRRRLFGWMRYGLCDAYQFANHFGWASLFKENQLQFQCDLCGYWFDRLKMRRYLVIYQSLLLMWKRILRGLLELRWKIERNSLNRCHECTHLINTNEFVEVNVRVRAPVENSIEHFATKAEAPA